MPNTTANKAAIITKWTGIGFEWKSDPFTPSRSWRVCTVCKTYLHLHNPTGQQILGWCDKCKNNAVIETFKEAR